MDTEIDRIKKQALEIKEKIESGSLLERISILNEYYKKWIIKPDSRNSMFDYLNLALHNFGLDPNNLQIGTFERAKKVVKFELQYLNLQFMQDDEVLEDSEMKSDIQSKINKISKALVDADNAIQSTLYLKSSMTQEDIGHELKQDIFRFSEINYEDNIPYQNLLLYLMEKLKRNKYRRYVQESKGMCYQNIYTDNSGFETHAWKPAMTIKEFIHDETRKDFNFAMWQNATAAKDNVKAATTYLTEFLGGEFEDLKRDRHVFSFKNGIYFTKVEDNLKDQFVPYTGPGSKKIGASVVACKYFNQDFVDYTYNPETGTGYVDWFDIIKNHCPNIKHVMEYQEWTEDVQRWLFILIGRMFYNVGELDDWQCLPYLLGQGGSGKSLGYDSEVISSDGKIKKIQNIKVGDLLMGDDSTPRKVLAVDKAKDKLYHVHQINGDTYTVNGDHILCLKMTYCTKRIINEKEYKVGDIVEISVNDYLKLPDSVKKALKGYKVPIIFKEKEVPLDPYLLGLWLNQDSKNDGYKSIDDKIKIIFKDIDLINHIPDIYKYNSRENQLKLLAGLLDGSSDSDNCYDFIQKNYSIAKDVEYIARCLGFSAKVEEGSCMYYRLCISGHGLEEIPIKRASPRKQIKNNLHTDIKVVPVDQEYYNQGPEYEYRYSIQIDGNQRYVLGDHTVTHNSSILMHIIKLMYEPADIGILSNNMEKKFGLGALANKLIFIGPEIKGDLSLEQSEFQSIISGEDVQLNIKNQLAYSKKWDVPGMVAGNVVPQYTDNSGSIARRIVVFPFDNKVKKGDGDSKLGKKLESEVVSIMQAANKAYLQALEEHGSKDIWSILPEKFRETKEEMAENTNGLTHFLNSEEVKLRKDLYCREKIFIIAFNEHCREHNLGAYKWSSQFYSGPFSDYGITVNKNTHRKYPNNKDGQIYSGRFVFGIDIADFEKVKSSVDNEEDLL